MVKNKDMQFFMENLKIKRKKGQKKFDLLERGFEPRIFNHFPAHESTNSAPEKNFHGK